jgi:hypothetical protein
LDKFWGGVDGRPYREIDNPIAILPSSGAIGCEQIPGKIREFDSLLSGLRESNNSWMIGVGGADLGSSSRRTDRCKECRVDLAVLLPIAGNVILVIDRLYWADRLAGTAINALIGLDVEHPITLINTINRALFNAGLILDIHTRLGDYVGHFDPFK